MIRALFAILLLFGAAACAERKTGGDWPVAAPALWEVTAPRGQRGWLFGTIHALPREVRWRTPALDDALADAGLLIVETAALNDDAAGAAAFRQVATSPGLPPLLQRVSPRARPALTQALERGEMDEGDFAETESWAAALTILNAERSSETGIGVDRVLLRSGLPVAGLETHAQLFAVFDGLSGEDQRQLLELASVMRAPAEEHALVRDWLTGDLPALERRMNGDILADPQLREALLVRRNAAWLPQVMRAIERGRRPLVAVGTAHLIGTVGLPAQLAAHGYTVRRVQ